MAAVDAIVSGLVNLIFRILEWIIRRRLKKLSYERDVAKLRKIALESSYSNERETAISTLGALAKQGSVEARDALLDMATSGRYTSERELALRLYYEVVTSTKK